MNSEDWHNYCLETVREIKKQLTPSTDEMLEELSKVGSIEFETYFLKTIREFFNERYGI